MSIRKLCHTIPNSKEDVGSVWITQGPDSRVVAVESKQKQGEFLVCIRKFIHVEETTNSHVSSQGCYAYSTFEGHLVLVHMSSVSR